MGRLFVITLEGDVYCCKHCRTHLAFSEDILSKSFYCKYGKAYLFDNVVNVTVGEEEERMMTTGFHTVVDIFCVGCGLIVGWRYEFAEAKEEKYKEGKYIIERFKVLGPDGTPHPMLSPEPDNVETDADDDDDDDEDDDDEDDDDDDDDEDD